METSAPAILELALLLLAAAAAGWVARRAGLPAVVGYLAVGAAVSPFTPGFVAHREQLELLADIGVILLLFEVGIEIDILRLRREQRALVWIAPTQVLLTTLIGLVVGLLAGLSVVASALIGLAVALSSSVVIVNITRSRTAHDRSPHRGGAARLERRAGRHRRDPRRRADRRHGQRRDAAARRDRGPRRVHGPGLWWPGCFRASSRSLHGENDMFLIVSVASGLAIAGAGALVFHVPMALAAFIAGLTISESHHAQEARRRLLPFRDLFAVLFFVAIGTLIDPGQLAVGWGWLLALLAVVLVGKVGVSYVLARLGRLAGTAGAARRRTWADRRVQLRPGFPGPRDRRARSAALQRDPGRRGDLDRCVVGGRAAMGPTREREAAATPAAG